MAELIKELFAGPSKAFENHLAIPFNERIIFSGIYGIGKTTFLKDYFNRSEIQEKYNAIHLLPVNYSILENEDVFRYLKYDILYELVETFSFEFKNEHFEFWKTLPFFLKGNALQIFATFLLLIPKLGKQLFQFSEEMQKLEKQFERLQKGADKNEHHTVSRFIKSVHEKEGGVYENNELTQLIGLALEDLKGDKELKRNILIIDDLDRIDPNHVFRLFNVFAAHFDQRYGPEKSNKFGFDQVIFVCDIENIRGLFRNQYGINIDFNGYIDKFYSRSIFSFDNKASIMTLIDKSIRPEILPNGPHLPYDRYGDALEDLKFVFKCLARFDLVNLRILLKFLTTKLAPAPIPVKFKNESEEIYFVQSRALILTHILLQFYGDPSYLLEQMEKCAKMFDYSKAPQIKERIYSRMIGDLLVFLHEPLYDFRRASPKEADFYLYKDGNIELKFYYHHDFTTGNIVGILSEISIVNNENRIQIEIQEYNYFHLYVKFLQILKKKDYLKT